MNTQFSTVFNPNGAVVASNVDAGTDADNDWVQIPALPKPVSTSPAAPLDPSRVTNNSGNSNAYTTSQAATGVIITKPVKPSQGPTSREAACALKNPDIKFNCGGQIFYAHRSILQGYYTYWSSLFSHNWAESGKNEIVVDEFDPKAFEKVLDWLYTHNLVLDEIDPANLQSELDKIKNVKLIADCYLLEELSKECDSRINRLTKLIENKLDSTRRKLFLKQYMVQNRQLCSFSTPENKEVFHDTKFEVNKVEVKGNAILLATRSCFFRSVFDNQCVIPPSNLSPEFYQWWIERIESGQQSDLSGWDRWITPNTVFDILRIAHADNLSTLIHLCCDKFFYNLDLSPPLAKEDLALIQYISFTDKWSDKQEKLWVKTPNNAPKNIIISHASRVKPRAAHFENNGKNVLSLDLRGCSWVDGKFVRFIADHCPNLRELRLDGCEINDSDIEYLTQKLSSTLEVLGLSGCNIGDPGVKAISNCKALRSLYLEGCRQVTYASVETITRRCNQLKVLDLKHGPHIRKETIELFKTLTELRTLSLTASLKDGVGWGPDDESIEGLLCSCPYLEALRINGNNGKGLTDKAVACLDGWKIHLKELELPENNYLTDASYILITQSCPLRTLIINASKDVTEKTFEALQDCKDLKEFGFNGDLVNTSPECFEKLIPTLEILKLNKVRNATAFEKIAKHCPRLKGLELGPQSNIEASMIEAVLENCEELKSLALLFCKHLPDVILARLTELNELESLYLEDCDIHHRTLLKLVGNSNLNTLILVACHSITLLTIREIRAQCTTLNLVVNCRQFSAEDVKGVHNMAFDPPHWVHEFIRTPTPEGFSKLLSELQSNGALVLAMQVVADKSTSSIALKDSLIAIRNIDPLIDFPSVQPIDIYNFYKFRNDLFDQAQLQQKTTVLTYEDFGKLVAPDVTLIAGSKEFRVHGSVLQLFPQWLLKLTYTDGRTVKLENVDPNTFEVLLNWYYTKHLPYIFQGFIQLTTKDLVDKANLEIQHVRKVQALAATFEVAGLVQACQIREAELEARKLEAQSNKNVMLHLAPKYIPRHCEHTFSHSNDHEPFNDFDIQCNDTLFHVNIPILAMRSLAFCSFFKHFQQGAQRSPYVMNINLSPQFMGEWISRLYSGKLDELAQDNHIVSKIYHTQVYDGYRLARLENYSHLGNNCSYSIIRDMFKNIYGVKPIPPDKAVWIDYLYIEHWRLFKNNFMDVLPNISHINFQSHLYMPDADVTEFIEWLTKHGKRLRRIKLSNCPWVSNRVVKAIAESCPILQEIDLGANDDEAMKRRDLNDEGVIELAKKCKYLQIVNLNGFHGNIKDPTILEFAKCPQLRELHLNTCSSIGDSAISKIAENVNLEVLHLHDYGSSKLTLDTVHKLAHNCSRLRELSCGLDADYKASSEAINRYLRFYCKDLINGQISYFSF